MRKAVRFVMGAIMGGILGGAIVLLLAPGSGNETRTAIQQRLIEIKQQMRKAIDERQAFLEEELEKFKSL